MADEVVRSRFEAETSGYDRAVEGAAKATDRLADSADKAGKATEQMGDRGQKSAQKVEQAQKRATTAQDKSADAAGRLRVAQERLNAARESKDTGRIVAAEENVAKAQRDVERTAQEAAAAQDALQRGLAESGNEAQQSVGKFERLSKAVKDHRGDMETVGTSLLGIGAGLTAVSVGAGKAAMDWESAWAGVMKTNDGTSEQTQQLEDDLRALTGVLPATHTEIAAVAEAAGQLGVGIDDVAGFSKVMLDLGETTNLSADEAATALARFSNIMGTSFDDADKLGSTIVGLGNNFATTEAEIVGMSMRVAAVGRQMGMSESDVLALSTAMSSVGVEAEAGGTAISNVMKKIDSSVREGGDSLLGWAEAAGVSAQEFAAQWEADPARAMVTLTEGLGAVSESGGDVNGMLADLGVKGIRESDTLLRLASASGVLSSALDEGATAWEENIALAEEASVRYETTEAQIAMAWNQIKDAAIDAGGAILPIVATVAEGAAGIASAFAKLPDPVKGALGVLSGAGGLLAIAAGGFLTLTPRIMDTIDASRRLKETFPSSTTGLGKLGRAGKYAAGAAGLGALAVVLAKLHTVITDTTATTEEMTVALGELSRASDATSIEEKFTFDQGMKGEIEGLAGSLETLDVASKNFFALDGSGMAAHFGSFMDDLIGAGGNMTHVRKQFESLDGTLSGLDTELAAESMNNLRLQAEEAGRLDFSNWSSLSEILPGYAQSIRDLAEGMDVSLSEADLFQVAMGNMGPILSQTGDAAGDAAGGVDVLAESQEEAAAAAEELQEAIDAAVESIEIMGGAGRGVQAAQDDWLATIDGITDAVKENGRTLDENTEKGRNNRAELRGLADQGTSTAATMAEFGMSQEEVQGQLASTYEQLVAAGEGFGLGATEAQAMAREMLGIPPDVNVETWMSDYAAEVAALTANNVELIPENVQIIADMSEGALNKAFETAAAIQLIPGYKRVDVAVDDQGTPGQIQSRVDSITGETVHMFVTEDGTAQEVQQQVINIDGKDVPVYVKDDGTVVATQGKIDGIHGKTVSIDAQWNGGWVQTEINNIQGKTVRVDVVRRNLGQAAVANGGIAGLGYFPKHAEGRLPGLTSSLPAHAMGRLPYTGRGTDRILGVNAEGWPVARVDDGEGIIKESSTRKHLQLLGMVNDDDPRVSAVGRMLGLSGYAGGRVGREWSADAVAMPAQVGPVSASVDSGMIAAAVSRAMAGWAPIVNIGGRPFYGVMKQAESQYGGR